MATARRSTMHYDRVEHSISRGVNFSLCQTTDSK